MDNELRILHPGDPEAQTLARAIASPTAGEILQILGEEPMTASALAARLEIPITTAAYHLEHLVAAGVIEVTGTRWSRKGREQKIYRLVDRVVIVTPGREDLQSLLRKYAALGLTLAGAVLAAGLLQAWTASPDVLTAGSESANRLGEPAPASVPMDAAASAPGCVALYILLGGLVVLAALIVYDLIAARRGRA